MAGTVNQFSVFTNSTLVELLTTIRRATGTITPPPSPWSALAKVNSSASLEKAQHIEPVKNKAIERRKIRRGPHLSANHPLTGIIAAEINK
jgi:hypothetical protein